MNDYIRATGFGVVAGMRSMAAPAAAEIGRGSFGRPLLALAVGELIADKLPFAPSRISAKPLVLRVASGAFAGWKTTPREARPLVGAALGALGAVAGAYLGYGARRFAVERLHLPGALAALAEDAVVIGTILLLRSSDSER